MDKDKVENVAENATNNITLNDIVKIVFDKYIDDELIFDKNKFKKDYPNEYNFIMNKFKDINDFVIYLSVNKKNNKFINSLNDLKNYLALTYINQCRLNGYTYNDIVENTDFNYNQIRFLHSSLKNIFNIKDNFK